MIRKRLKLPSIWLDLTLIIVLIAAALFVRTPIALERKIMPAGDVFNLQHIADFMVRFDYPPKENRLPGFPALILLTRPFPVDPVQAAVGISLALSSLMLACLYGIGQTLGIHRLPLFAVLSLSVFDPLLTIGAVRPLSDATFLFFLSLYLFLVTRVMVSSETPGRRSLLLIGVATAAMFFTRFEGVAVAALTLPLLWLKLPWRKVLTAISIPFIAGLLWIPVHIHIHGSLTSGYLAAFSDPSGDFGNIHAVPSKISIMLKSAGWGNIWTLPAYEIDQEPKDEAISRLTAQGTWWMGLLAIIGMPWLLITKRTAALPLLAAAAGYMSILSLWFLYSRFVVPLVPIFYLTAAAGGSFLIHTSPKKLRNLFILATSVFLIWVLWTEAPPYHHQALGRAWESNGHGYAHFLSVRETAKLHEPTAYWTEAHAYATLYFKENGFYLNRHPDASPEELYELLRDHRMKNLINVGEDERLSALRELLRARGNITATTTHRSFYVADKSFETVDVDHLSW